MLQHYVDSGKSTDDIIHAATKLCMSLKIESRRVCEGLINSMAEEIIYVMARLILTADEICGFVIGDVCGTPYNPYHEWEVPLPPIPKPALTSAVPNSNVPPLKVLHLSDTHFDPYYQEGSNAACSEPLCCRITDGLPSQPSNGAGRWGDYRKCDTPKQTIESMFHHIANYHQVNRLTASIARPSSLFCFSGAPTRQSADRSFKKLLTSCDEIFKFQRSDLIQFDRLFITLLVIPFITHV